MTTLRNKLWVKLTAILSVFLLLDMVKPFGYLLSVEFLFLGIIFIALNCNLRLSLMLSIVFGYLKDSFIPGSKPLSVIEFPFLCLFSHYLITYVLFTDKKKYAITAKSIVIITAIFAHIVFNSIYTDHFLPFFFLHFVIQSFLVSLLINYLLEKRSYAKR